MPETVLVAIIGGAQAVIIAFVGVLNARIGRVSKDSAATRAQVENDHSTNLREEADDRHKETRGLLHGLARDIGGIRQELRQGHERMQGHDERIMALEQLEMTNPRFRKK